MNTCENAVVRRGSAARVNIAGHKATSCTLIRSAGALISRLMPRANTGEGKTLFEMPERDIDCTYLPVNQGPLWSSLVCVLSRGCRIDHIRRRIFGCENFEGILFRCGRENSEPSPKSNSARCHSRLMTMHLLTADWILNGVKRPLAPFFSHMGDCRKAVEVDVTEE